MSRETDERDAIQAMNTTLRIALCAALGIALVAGLPVGASVAAPQEEPVAAPQEEPALAPHEEVAQVVAGERDPTIDLFVAKCASCHSVGQGARIGPDLSGAHERRDRDWLTRMIETPSRMLPSDAIARQLLVEYGNVKMPDLGLTGDQVSSLIDLIERCSTVPCVLAAELVPVANATEVDVALGEALFLGYEPLLNGAAPCISCHTVRGAATIIPGGTLATDLTHTFARLGDEGLDAALRSPPFALMNKVFSDHPLDPIEAFALRAYLNEANRTEPPDTAALSLPLFGLLGAGLALVVLNAFWARRLRGVRQPLTRSATRRPSQGEFN